MARARKKLKAAAEPAALIEPASSAPTQPAEPSVFDRAAADDTPKPEAGGSDTAARVAAALEAAPVVRGSELAQPEPRQSQPDPTTTGGEAPPAPLEHQAPVRGEAADGPAPAHGLRPIGTITLGPTNDSPKMRLGRSEKFKQMQIAFEEKPDEKHLAVLREAGWKWREAEKIWSVQLDPNARWRTQAAAEQLFKDIGSAIRADLGLPPPIGNGR